MIKKHMYCRLVEHSSLASHLKDNLVFFLRSLCEVMGKKHTHTGSVLI